MYQYFTSREQIKFILHADILKLNQKAQHSNL